jgi:CheY-like chemotaxis protein
MRASAILLVDVDVAFDGPATLELSRRHLPWLALLDCKMQGMDVVEPCGHLKRILADTVGVLVTAFRATVHAANRRQPVGPLQAGAVGRLIPLIEAVAATPGRSGTEALPCAPAHRKAFFFPAKRRGGLASAHQPASAEPATSGLRKVVELAPVWPAPSLRALAKARTLT